MGVFIVIILNLDEFEENWLTLDFVEVSIQSEVQSVTTKKMEM